MSNENQETIADIVAWIRRHASVYGYDLADRIEAAAKREREAGAEVAQICGEIGEMVGREATREKYSQVGNAAAKRDADSIHRAMVLIAGIEMEDSNNPPRLWTALEDAYNALSDALGTDGEITADLEEAKVIGRHFVIKPYGNAAKMREALEQAQRVLHCAIVADILKGEDAHEALNAVSTALSAPPRNCDRFATAKEAGEVFISEACENPCGNCTVSDECYNPLVHECGIDWLFAEAKGETK